VDFRVSRGVFAAKGLLWNEGAVFGVALAVEVLRLPRRSSRRRNVLALVLMGCRGGNTRFSLIFLPNAVHLN